MSKTFNLYLGKGGEFSVVSEFLARGWNVALPVRCRQYRALCRPAQGFRCIHKRFGVEKP